MSLNERVRREDVLFRLVGALPGDEFGAGRPACHTELDAPAAEREAMAELFFPVSESAEHQIRRAKEICQSCPVQGSCLQFALRGGEDVGIWGGLTASERRRLRAESGDDFGEVAA